VTAATGDWCFPADPARSYDEQAVFWRPDVYAGVVTLAPASAAGAGAVRFTPAMWRGDIAQGEARERHLLLRGRLATHQMVASGSLEVGDAVAIATPADALFDLRTDAARALLRDLGGRVAAPKGRHNRRAKRLRAALAAYDVWLSEGSYRAVARQMFGAARVGAEPWKTSALRDAAIRLVGLSRRLIGGDYLKLLRARP
jgi:hypothetical protein